VIDRPLSFELLERASGAGAEETEAGVGELIRHRVLRPVGEQFELVHGHLHECVYEQLSPIRRKLLHRRVAKALEALHGSDNGRQIRMPAASSQLTEGGFSSILAARLLAEASGCSSRSQRWAHVKPWSR